MTFYVYALLEPSGDEIRYIGKSSNPARRLASHMSKSSSPAVREWIAVVGRPEVRILGTFTDETGALLSEQEWIKKLRVSGRLLNVAIHEEPVSVERVPGFVGFGDRCRARRTELGITQLGLAHRAGVSQPCLSRAEAMNTGGLTAETAIRLARVLGVSVEWLITGEARQELQAAE